MTFTEAWFSPTNCERLAELGRSVADVAGDIVEFGSWEGRSSIALAESVSPRQVQCVDTWEGSPGEISSELAAERDVYAQFCANTSGLNIVAHKMGWREFAVRPIALLFIDFEHTYQELYDCLTAYIPHLGSGGVICGDDVQHPPIRQALSDCFDPLDVEVVGTVWSWRKP